MFNNPKLDVIHIKAHVKFGQNPFILKILSGNKILMSFKGRNCNEYGRF